MPESVVRWINERQLPLARYAVAGIGNYALTGRTHVAKAGYVHTTNYAVRFDVADTAKLDQRLEAISEAYKAECYAFFADPAHYSDKLAPTGAKVRRYNASPTITLLKFNFS